MFSKIVLLVIFEKTAVTRVPIHLSEECVLRHVPAIEHFVTLKMDAQKVSFYFMLRPCHEMTGAYSVTP